MLRASLLCSAGRLRPRPSAAAQPRGLAYRRAAPTQRARACAQGAGELLRRGARSVLCQAAVRVLLDALCEQVGLVGAREELQLLDREPPLNGARRRARRRLRGGDPARRARQERARRGHWALHAAWPLRGGGGRDACRVR
eukprot:6171895-Pleurochrysis_carterae.AAC.1